MMAESLENAVRDAWEKSRMSNNPGFQQPQPMYSNPYQQPAAAFGFTQ